MRISARCTVAAGMAALLSAGTANAQVRYPQTMFWGSGLIDIPVAWVSPLTGDFSLSYTGQSLETSFSGLNDHGAIAFSFFGRVEVGAALYSNNPEYGLFGQVLLVNEDHFRGRPGLMGWIPSIALGARNVSEYDKIDRFGLGYELVQAPTSPGRDHEPDPFHQGFDTSPTFFGVVTKSFSLNELMADGPNVNFSFSAGYGNGLFEDDGGLGDAYSTSETGGLFGGVKVDVRPTAATNLSFMAEHNAWEINLGAAVEHRGIRASLYWTGLGNSGPNVPLPGAVPYNDDRLVFAVGWQSNVLAIFRPDILRRRVDALERQRDTLLAEVERRKARIAQLQGEIDRYEAQNLLELEQRRAEAEVQLREEREALRRLEERIRRLEEQRPTPPPARPPR
ncbi:MAG: hypothetical protein ACREON_01095 [Gemmatimonadaceae bacterium]